MEIPPSAPAEIDRPQEPDDKTKLPWPQLRLTGAVFQKAANEMEMVLGGSDGVSDDFSMPTSFVRGGWARTTQEFIRAHRLADPKRPGRLRHVSAERACQLLFDWVKEAKKQRREAEDKRIAAYFATVGQPSPVNSNPPQQQESLYQLHCRDILILLTCIFGFQDVAEVRRLAHAAPHLVLLASLLHRLFYAHTDSFSFESFRAEASGLLAGMGQYFDVELDGRA